LKRSFIKYLVSLLVGVLLLPLPLLRDFHFESAIVAAIVGCLWSGISAAKMNGVSDFFNALHISGYVYLAGVPLLFYALVTGCLTFEGVGFWILFPLPSIFLGQALGRLIRQFRIPAPRFMVLSILLLLSFGLFLAEFFTLPQVYFFNHVWGGWPGPIYDEAVLIDKSLLLFRFITLLWIVLIWNIPGNGESVINKWVLGTTVLLLMLSYTRLDEWGIIAPTETLQQELGSRVSTEHFEIFYPDDFFSSDEIRYWSAKHEFYFHQITNELDVTWPEGRKIQSYLYANAWQKKELVGAKFTSYVPVWLEKDQLHIAKPSLEETLKHELVHVIAKRFGNELFNASWSIGMIEGLATALAPVRSSESTIHQIVASEKPYPTSGELNSAFSFTGFYASAGSISYTTTGSFVSFLKDHYPVQHLRQAYKSGSFRVYEEESNASFDDLVNNWHTYLDSVSIDSVDRQVAEVIFGRQSIFEKECPHKLTKQLKLWDRYQYQLEAKDTLEANQTIDRLAALSVDNPFIQTEWLHSLMDRGAYDRVIQVIPERDTLLTHQLLKGDALVLTGNYSEASQLLEKLRPRIGATGARQFRYSIDLRKDSMNWHHHVDRRYNDRLPGMELFSNISAANRALSMNRAVQLSSDSLMVIYVSALLSEPANPDWFDIYEDAIDRLVFLGEGELADEWINKLGGIALRSRYEERLKSLKAWLIFKSGSF